MSDERIPIDQFLDLVEGNLPEEEAARLDATLDEGDRRELAVQAAVRSVLGQLPGPELSDDERQRLRAAVRAELRVEEVGPAPSAGRQERRSWLVRVLPSAAAAATVVAVIAVAVNLVDTDSGQEASMADVESAVTAQAAAVTAAPAPTPTTTAAMSAESAAAMEAAPAADVEADLAEAEVAMEEAMAEAEAAADLAEAEMEAALAEAAEPEVAAEAAAEAAAELAQAAADATEEAAFGPGYVAFEVATDRPDETREALEMMEELAAISEMTPVPVTELADRAGEEGLVCWPEAAELAGASGVITWMAPGLVDGVAGEAYMVAPGPDDQPADGVLALFVYPDCRAVALPAVTDE